MDYKWHKCKQGEIPEDIASPEMIINRGIKEEYSGYIGNILCYNPNNMEALQYWIGSRYHGSAIHLDTGKIDIFPWTWSYEAPTYWRFIEPVNIKNNENKRIVR